MADPAPDDAPRLSRADRIKAMADYISDLAERRRGSAGDLAALRRLDPDCLDRPAFWKMMVSVDRGAMGQPTRLRAWAMIAAGMARMAPFHHAGTAPPGRVLAETEFQEGRLEQLLRARGDHVWPTVRRLCDFLSARAEPIDWRELGGLLLAHEDDVPDHAERFRHAIARAYYFAIADKTAQEGTR